MTKETGTESTVKRTTKLSVQPTVLSNQFQLEEILGQGGMGTVYRARDLHMQDQPLIAIKLLNDELKNDPAAVTGLERECRRVRMFAHDSIVRVFAFYRSADHVFITMELLQGEPMDVVMKRYPDGMPYTEAWPIIKAAGEALSYVHHQNPPYIHYDFKPKNIFLTQDGRTKVLDFGVARAVMPQEGAGTSTRLHETAMPGYLTPGYASCEMLTGLDPDPRDDVYSLACFSYELLSGHPPFRNGERTVDAIKAKILKLTPPPIKALNVTENRVLLGGLAYDREHRTASVDEFLIGLSRSATPKGTRLAPIAFAAVVLAGAGIATGFGVRYWSAGLRPGQPAAVDNSGAIRAADPISIIVVPFANHTGDTQKAYIADAVTASITADIGRIQDAYVVPAPTAYAFNGKSVPVQQLAREAQVRFVLLGSVQNVGPRLRISVQLFDGFTATQLRSQTFEGDVADLFALQDRVTTLVGNSMGREMVIAAARDIQGTHAPDLLLRARALYLRPASAVTFKQIEDIYRDLLKRDPDNPTATIGLATILTTAASLGLQIPKTPDRLSDMYREAQQLAERAQELELRGPDVDRVLGYCALSRGEFATAERSFKGVLEQAPNDPQSYNALGVLAYMQFEGKKALGYFSRATALLPGTPDDYVVLNSAFADLELGDYAAAIDAIEKALVMSPHLDPAFGIAAVAYSLSGNDVAAAKWAQKAKGASVLPTDLGGFIKGSDSYEHWMQNVVLPTWRKLGLPM